ncbi:MAG: hypothetical protein ABSG03_16550 [Bryobacteraceae bacterium]|jgi:hypothetical protein
MIARFTTITLALLVAGQADTLRLRTGAALTGTWLGGTPDEVRFMVDDRVERYPRADVVSVEFTSTGISNTIAPEAPVAPPPVLEPNVTGVPFMRGASGFLSLERAYAMLVRSNQMYGMGPTVYRIQGPQSPVRVGRGDKIVFVLRLNSGGDPRRFELYQLESRMNFRQTQPSMGGGRPPALPVTIDKISDYTYEISPARQLYPGEYSFSRIDSNESYCFGVNY